MGISALTPPTRSDGVVETLLEFPDNRLLIELCGEFDRNLAQIEHQMGVHVLRRGNRLAVIGDRDEREQAAAVMRGLYARLEAGRAIVAGDIDGAIRLGRAPGAAETLRGGAGREAEQIELFGGAPMELRTRKKPIEPRTPGAESLCRQLVPERAGLRHRPGRHRQDLSRRGGGGDDVHFGRGGPDRAVAPRGRGGRAAGLPARRHEGEGRSLHAAALRRAERFPARQAGAEADRGEADRDRAAGLHARAHAVATPSSCWTRRRTRRRCR